MRFGENETDLSVAALWLVIGGEVFHIEGQPGRQVLCLGNVTLNVQFTNDCEVSILYLLKNVPARRVIWIEGKASQPQFNYPVLLHCWRPHL